MLVILEHILTGERFAQYANHLSPQDRQAAKSLLENQRSVLRQRVQNHLEAAYGLEALTPGSLDTTHELEPHEQFVSLRPGFEPQPPVAANLAGAMEHLLSQALEHEFPAAPQFEAEVKTSNLQKVYEQVQAATQTDGRTGGDRQDAASAAAAYRQSAAAGRDGVRRHALRAWPALEEPLHPEGRRDRQHDDRRSAADMDRRPQADGAAPRSGESGDSALRRADQSLVLSPRCSV